MQIWSFQNYFDGFYSIFFSLQETQIQGTHTIHTVPNQVSNSQGHIFQAIDCKSCTFYMQVTSTPEKKANT